MNNWVSNVTQGQIDSLVDEFAPNTKLFLANALFFKDSWLSPFRDTDAKVMQIKPKVQNYKYNLSREIH